MNEPTTNAGYRASHLHPEQASAYDAAFSEEPYRRMVWQQERSLLDQIVSEHLGDRAFSHLDFACGTGRILAHIERYAASSLGVDLSRNMLAFARRNTNDADVVEADLTRADPLGSRRFDLITAFRFFPNAERELRREAMRALARHLTDDGFLVFNNHKNTASTRNRAARLLGRRGFQGMSPIDVSALVAENGLEVVATHGLCVFPASDAHPLLPVPLLAPVDSMLARCAPLKKLGENQIFVCRRVPGWRA